VLLSDHHSSDTTKLLLVGDSGSGKTGALASLAKAGYNLRILDLDNGLDILKNLLTTSGGPYGEDAAARVHFKTLTEPMRAIAGKLSPVKATVWTEMTKMLTEWKDGETSLGPVTSWGPKDILVIDSLSTAAKAAYNHHRALNGRLAAVEEGNEWRRDMGASQSYVESLLQLLFDQAVSCNVIVIAHVTYVDDQGTGLVAGDNRPQTGYPAALGKALSPKIPRYFNTVLMAKTVGTGSATKHKIFTKSQGIVSLKSSAPLKVKDSYELATGLAEYFEAVRG